MCEPRVWTSFVNIISIKYNGPNLRLWMKNKSLLLIPMSRSFLTPPPHKGNISALRLLLQITWNKVQYVALQLKCKAERTRFPMVYNTSDFQISPEKCFPKYSKLFRGLYIECHSCPIGYILFLRALRFYLSICLFHVYDYGAGPLQHRHGYPTRTLPWLISRLIIHPIIPNRIHIWYYNVE